MEKSPIINTIKKVLPAVVSIVISKELPRFERLPISPFESLILPVPSENHEKTKIGGGSGFIVSKDGTVLTNRHIVIDPEAEYTAITQDNKKYNIKVLARDEINDVAILKIAGKNFSALELGDSTKLRLGQTVLAFGNVLGQFQNTVSSGIVSGLSRFITAQVGIFGKQERLRGLIQTDAAINPGNSGGPLVDIEGKVIGINTAVVLGAQNISFAIPINTAKKDLAELKKYRRIRQPFLGIRYFLLNPGLQKRYNLPFDYGALIIREELPKDVAVVPGSNADKAGLQELDVVLQCGLEKINEENTLQDILHKHQIGDILPLKIWRNGKELLIKVELGEKK